MVAAQGTRSSLPLALGTFFAGVLIWYAGGTMALSRLRLEHPNAVLWSISVFISIVLMSYYFSRTKKVRISRRMDGPLVVRQELSHPKIFIGLSALAIIFMYGQFAGGMVAYHSGRMIPVIGIVAGLIALTRPYKYRLAYALIFIAMLLLCLTFYSRRPFLTVLAVPLLMFALNKRARRATMVTIAVVGTLSLMALVFVTGLRTAGWAGNLAEVPLIFNVGVDAMLDGQGLDTIVLLDYVISRYPDVYPYLDGSSVLAVLVNPIPRVLWPDKPISFGIELAARYFNVLPDAVPTNFGPGIVAEAYANGGWLAVALAAAVVGYFLARLDNTIATCDSTIINRMLIVILVPAIFFLVRGDLLNACYEAAIKVLPAYAVLSFGQRSVRIRQVARIPYQMRM